MPWLRPQPLGPTGGTRRHYLARTESDRSFSGTERHQEALRVRLANEKAPQWFILLVVLEFYVARLGNDEAVIHVVFVNDRNYTSCDVLYHELPYTAWTAAIGQPKGATLTLLCLGDRPPTSVQNDVEPFQPFWESWEETTSGIFLVKGEARRYDGFRGAMPSPKLFLAFCARCHEQRHVDRGGRRSFLVAR